MVSLAADGSSALLSPSDITHAATCEYGWLRLKVDPRLGWAPPLGAEDAFMERVSALGDAHEQRVLARFEADHGVGVVRLARPEPYTAENIAVARRRTLAALEDPKTTVIFQAMLHDGEFGGLADFLVRQPDGRFQVVDTKLARHARVSALLQIAAYADLLDGMGVPRARRGGLWLGDGTERSVDLDEVIPVYRHQRARLERLLAAHIASGEPVRWGDDRLSVCGACEACAEAVAEHRDVLLTAGSTRVQRARLRAAGIETVEQLAASTAPPAGMTERSWRGLRDQAALQLEQPLPDGTPPFRIEDPEAVLRLPAPSEGDVFFDFEGDPLWVSPHGAMEGLEYLWGWVEAAPGRSTAETSFQDFRFTALWADTRAEERAALEAFVAFVEERRRAHPDMRIYHYAPYEVTALKRLVVSHGVGERELDDWLRAGLFVDLYSTVRAALRAGVPSYSIKKLEPLYMGQDHRSEDGVTTAADSVTEYHAYVAAREAARDAEGPGEGAAAEADRIRAGIEDYNRYDCVSTARLRDWLLAQVGRGGDNGTAALRPDEGEHLAEPAPGLEDEDAQLESALLALLPTAQDPDAELDDEQLGMALLAAGMGFYQREDKPVWWAYFDRGISPTDEWQDARSNLLADRVDVVEDWHRPKGARTFQRVLRMTGSLEPGTTLQPGAEAVTVYEDVPESRRDLLQPNAVRWVGAKAVVQEVEDRPDGSSVVLVRERIPAQDAQLHPQLPMAAFAHTVVNTDKLKERLRQRARAAVQAGRLPGADAVDTVGAVDTESTAAFDVLARRSPATSGRPLAAITTEMREGRTAQGPAREGWEALVEALESARGSYVAVQGPPGTGKTHVGSHAVKALLERGWSVGVTAQSHAVVENFLGKLVSIGVPKEQVVKAERRGKEATERPWTTVERPWGFIGAPGHVVGGTAWTFASEHTEPFDLLVIDEAGQFSLAHTLAAAAMARTVLLLGDPQQLPQVVKGTHPQPIGDAALSWLTAGEPVLRPDRGFFLDTSWRMHSALTEAVSTLSYAGELGSKEDVTDARHLDGVEPGLHPVPVEHTGNAVSSPEEAEAVVEIIRGLLGRTWRKRPDDPGRPLEASDVIVVAPYNAQVATVEAALEAAGLEETTVGTVDKFQGREAAVAILTMAASSAQDVARGLDFLLNRNRLNVSISRGQWACFLVHSPALADALPTDPDDLPMIGAFLRLIHRPAPSAADARMAP